MSQDEKSKWKIHGSGIYSVELPPPSKKNAVKALKRWGLLNELNRRVAALKQEHAKSENPKVA